MMMMIVHEFLSGKCWSGKQKEVSLSHYHQVDPLLRYFTLKQIYFLVKCDKPSV